MNQKIRKREITHQGPEESGVDSKSTMMGNTCRDRQLQYNDQMQAYLAARSRQQLKVSLMSIKLEAACLHLCCQAIHQPLFCNYPIQLLQLQEHSR
jgi:hypothetical protein